MMGREEGRKKRKKETGGKGATTTGSGASEKKAQSERRSCLAIGRLDCVSKRQEEKREFAAARGN